MLNKKTWLIASVCASFAMNGPGGVTLWAQVQQDHIVTRSRRGDSLRVDTTLLRPGGASVGMAKVVITNPRRLSPADRNLLVVFYLGGQVGSGSVAYRVPVVLGEGQRSVEVEIPHTYNASQQSTWDVQVFEGGRNIEDRRNLPRNQLSYQWIYNGGGGTQAHYAILKSPAEDADVLEASVTKLFPKPAKTTTSPSPFGGSQVQLPGAAVYDLTDVSPDWRCFSVYSGWLVSSGTVMEINARHPQVAKALRTFIAAGGRVLVFDVKDSQRIAEVEKMLASGNGPATAIQWTSLDGNDSGVFRLEADSADRDAAYDELFTRLSESENLSRKYLSGRVLLTAASIDKMPRLPLQSDFYHRGGVNAGFGSGYDGNWFWRNLITSVGKPPVWAFCVMVALFSAVLGPGLLIFTGRAKRRSLMIFLVPMISLVATVAVISYGVFHEGFGSYIRVASVTRIDPAANVGFAWSRQNYFSGLPPREGLAVPNDVYMRPVAAENDGRSVTRDPRDNISYRINLDGQTQHWQGWLKPRQQQQMLVGHIVESPKSPVALKQGAELELEVTNVSDFALPFFVARGGEDEYYFAKDIAPGATVVMEPEEKIDVGSDVAKEMVVYRPSTPPELEDGGTLFDFGRNRRNRSSSTATSKYEMLNSAMTNYLSSNLNMEPYSFATLLPKNDELQILLEGTQEENLHILIGVQPW